jgi:hypothetical protein
MLIAMRPVDDSWDSLNAYRSAARELREALVEQEALQRRIVSLRKAIETLKSRCRNEGIELPLGDEASELLQNPLPDQIREVLKANAPEALRPNQVLADLKQLGFELGKYKYQNPQATIQMLLKRMCGSGEVKEEEDQDGKKTYKYLRVQARRDL